MGSDLDRCRDPETGTIEPWAQEIIDEIRSYTEISPSGTGIRILAQGSKPTGRCRKGSVEIYDHGRYLTVTGDHCDGTPTRIRRCPRAIGAVCARVFGEADQPHQTDGDDPVAIKTSRQSDDEIIRRAAEARNGDKFKRLWAGDTNGYNSHSEADLALCGLLAFWVGPDSQRIDHLFRQSGLNRAKWEEREDYRHRVIAKALDGRTEFYAAKKATDAGGDSGGKKSQATRLVQYAREALDLFHTPEGVAYATTKGKPQQTWSLRSRVARQFLSRLFYLREETAPGGEAILTTINTLEGVAVHDGPVHPVFIRLAEYEGKVYLDLGGDD